MSMSMQSYERFAVVRHDTIVCYRKEKKKRKTAFDLDNRTLASTIIRRNYHKKLEVLYLIVVKCKKDKLNIMV